MVKELEKLNDFVDGFLSVTLDEEEGTFQQGKVTFLNKFRDYLAKVSSDTAGNELVKALNRGLLRAGTLPVNASINQKKGFESALKEVQEKIKALFNLDDLSTGTIKQYLQDIPKIEIPKKAQLPPAEMVFGQGDDAMSGVDKIKLEADKIAEIIDRQVAILEKHAANNGIVIVLSDEGYTDLNDIDGDALAGLIQGSKKSKQQMYDMVEKSLALMNMIKNRRKKGGDGKDKPSSGNDFLDRLLNGDDEDPGDD